MHLAFIDIAYDYTADRPDKAERLGGTTSAICFLTRELVKAGIGCTIFNTLKQPQEAHGVWSRPLGDLADALRDPTISAFIFCGRWMEKMAGLARAHTKKPLIAWMHESAFDPVSCPALDIFNGVVYVSTWQQYTNQNSSQPHWKQTVIHNAMNPKAAELFAGNRPILPIKTKPPILLYAGHFQRGAFHIPPILDELRKTQNDFSVEIFSEIHPIRDPAVDGQYINWLRSLPNVAHVGFVPQNELIRRMEHASFFIAPNPWPETSCIALIEAMATGLSVITTNRAALPETASGFAQFIPVEDPDHLTRFDMPMPHTAFAAAIFNSMDERHKNPQETEARLRVQIDYFLANYQWNQRVAPWVEFIKSLG